MLAIRLQTRFIENVHVEVSVKEHLSMSVYLLPNRGMLNGPELASAVVIFTLSTV